MASILAKGGNEWFWYRVWLWSVGPCDTERRFFLGPAHVPPPLPLGKGCVGPSRWVAGCLCGVASRPRSPRRCVMSRRPPVFGWGVVCFSMNTASDGPARNTASLGWGIPPRLTWHCSIVAGPSGAELVSVLGSAPSSSRPRQQSVSDTMTKPWDSWDGLGAVNRLGRRTFYGKIP